MEKLLVYPISPVYRAKNYTKARRTQAHLTESQIAMEDFKKGKYSLRIIPLYFHEENYTMYLPCLCQTMDNITTVIGEWYWDHQGWQFSRFINYYLMPNWDDHDLIFIITNGNIILDQDKYIPQCWGW